jgi:hypothetical protein
VAAFADSEVNKVSDKAAAAVVRRRRWLLTWAVGIFMEVFF